MNAKCWAYRGGERRGRPFDLAQGRGYGGIVNYWT
jgi:hypothetical protein